MYNAPSVVVVDGRQAMWEREGRGGGRRGQMAAGRERAPDGNDAIFNAGKKHVLRLVNILRWLQSIVHGVLEHATMEHAVHVLCTLCVTHILSQLALRGVPVHMLYGRIVIF